jgi:hypothetical protein
MHRWLLAWSFALAACSGSTPAPTPDASGPAPRTFGTACVTPSDTSTECDSGVCTDTIDKAGHPVCSLQCTAATVDMCPVDSLGTKVCNMKGYCKP